MQANNTKYITIRHIEPNYYIPPMPPMHPMPTYTHAESKEDVLLKRINALEETIEEMKKSQKSLWMLVNSTIESEISILNKISEQDKKIAYLQSIHNARIGNAGIIYAGNEQQDVIYDMQQKLDLLMKRVGIQQVITDPYDTVIKSSKKGNQYSEWDNHPL